MKAAVTAPRRDGPVTPRVARRDRFGSPLRWNAATHTQSSILALQRSAGNEAVAGLLAVQRSPGPSPVLRQGSQGPAVVNLQQLLGIKADGAFGPGTRQAVVAYQKANGLTADGVVGAKTWAALEAGGGQPTPEAMPSQAAAAALLAQIRDRLRLLSQAKVAPTGEAEPAPGPEVARQDFLDDALDWAGNTVSEVGDTVGGVVDTVTETVGGAVDTVTETVGGAVDSVTEAVGGVVDSVTETVGGAVDTVTEAVAGVAADVGSAIGELADDVKREFASEIKALEEIGQQLLAGLTGGDILGKLQEIWKGLTGGGDDDSDKDGGDLAIGEIAVDRAGCASADRHDATEDATERPSHGEPVDLQLRVEPVAVAVGDPGAAARPDIVSSPTITFRGEFSQTLPAAEVTGWGKEKPYLSMEMVHWDRENGRISVRGALKIRCLYNIEGHGKKDISGPDDPKITAKNWPDVVKDLTPNENGYPARNEFWASDITAQHEQFHAGDDYLRAKEDVEEGRCLSPIKNVQVNDPDKELPAKLEKVRDEVAMDLNQYYDPSTMAGEARAYTGTRHLYDKRVEEITEKGKAGKY